MKKLLGHLLLAAFALILILVLDIIFAPSTRTMAATAIWLILYTQWADTADKEDGKDKKPEFSEEEEDAFEAEYNRLMSGYAYALRFGTHTDLIKARVALDYFVLGKVQDEASGEGQG